jgi:DNA-binding MarR family transcriptional regulator
MANVYTLTGKGKGYFSKMRNNMSLTQTEGYLVLDDLFENGTDTASEIARQTGLSSGQVMRKIEEFEKQGLVQILTDL